MVAVTVVRSGPAAEASSLSYVTSDLTAVGGQDYTTASGTLNWAANDSSPRTIFIRINNSTSFAGTRAFTVALYKPSIGAIIGSPGSARVIISGAASAGVGTLAFADANASVSQRASYALISVTRSDGAVGPTSVNYQTIAGSAQPGVDFIATSGVLNWADGDSAAKTIKVAWGPAAPYSGSRDLMVTLSNAANGALLGDIQTTIITIIGDATPAVGTIQLSAAQYAVGQSSGHAMILAERVGGSHGSVAVSYSTASASAVAGADFTTTSGSLQWQDGDTSSRTIDVPLNPSPAFSGTRAFNIDLSAPSAAGTISNPASATVTITGDGASSSPAKAFWVYRNGMFNWGGDYSAAVNVNYRSDAGAPESGLYDIAINLTAPWGLFLPYAGGTVPLWNFDASSYNYLVVDLKPTTANQTWTVFFIEVGDKSIVDANGKPETVNVADYGPTPVVGQWATYKIPLSAVLMQHSGGQAILETSIYKFGIQDQTGLSNNLWYVDNVGFVQ